MANSLIPEYSVHFDGLFQGEADVGEGVMLLVLE